MESNRNSSRTRSELDRLIDDLKAELDRSPVADPERAERINLLVERLETQSRRGEELEVHDSLINELREEAVEFEVEHPDAAAVWRRMMQLLSSVGI